MDEIESDQWKTPFLCQIRYKPNTNAFDHFHVQMQVCTPTAYYLLGKIVS
jgi:hypothetical protein